jgi:hypothetical protein
MCRLMTTKDEERMGKEKSVNDLSVCVVFFLSLLFNFLYQYVIIELSICTNINKLLWFYYLIPTPLPRKCW